MDINGLLGNVSLPDGALEALRSQGRTDIPLANGVAMYSGHDRGVAYRFFIHQEYRTEKSKISKYPVYENIEMIEWQKDRFSKPTERLCYLPVELLFIDEDGTASGQYAEDYKRWKLGMSAPGLSLAKWGELGDSEIQSLTHMGIFSVEQFASINRDKINRMPEVFVDALEKAIIYVSGKEARKVTDEQTNRILELEVEKSKANDRITLLQEQVQALMSGNIMPKQKRNRGPNKPKIITSTEG